MRSTCLSVVEIRSDVRFPSGDTSTSCANISLLPPPFFPPFRSISMRVAISRVQGKLAAQISIRLEVRFPEGPFAAFTLCFKLSVVIVQILPRKLNELAKLPTTSQYCESQNETILLSDASMCSSNGSKIFSHLGKHPKNNPVHRANLDRIVRQTLSYHR